MRKVVQLAPVIDPETGEDVRHVLEELDVGWGCFTHGESIPEFKRARYVAPDNVWTHDHCEFCWTTFLEEDDNGIGTLGWILNDPGDDVPMKASTSREWDGKSTLSTPTNVRSWVCDDCHRVISAWANKALIVTVIGEKEIAGTWNQE